MGLSSTDAVILRDSTGTYKYFFYPGAMEYVGERRTGNNAVTVCESGTVKVTQVTSNTTIYHDFIVKEMQENTEATSDQTASGWNLLTAFIQNVAEFQGNVIYICFSGTADSYPGNYVDCRYWSGALSFTERTKDKRGTKLTFREEIT